MYVFHTYTRVYMSTHMDHIHVPNINACNMVTIIEIKHDLVSKIFILLNCVHNICYTVYYAYTPTL